MNYLSRQVDMSQITVDLSSSPDVGVNAVWSPGTTVKQAVRGFLLGFFGFLDVLIFLVLTLIPIFALWLIVVGLLLWLSWKIIKWLLRIITGKHQ